MTLSTFMSHTLPLTFAGSLLDALRRTGLWSGRETAAGWDSQVSGDLLSQRHDGQLRPAQETQRQNRGSDAATHVHL